MNLRKENHGGVGITNVFQSAAPPAQTKKPAQSPSPFSLRLTVEERERLSELAGNKPLGAYIRARLLGEHTKKRRRIRKPGLDHQKLALILAELGRSRLAANVNQLAKAANTGSLDLSDETILEINAACQAIGQMREMLIKALGIMPEADE